MIITSTFPLRKSSLAICVGLLTALTLAPRADAQVNGYNLFEEDFLSQTGSSTVTSTSWAATANLILNGSSDATAVDVILPDGTDDSLLPNATNPTAYAYRQNFASQSDMESVFPPNSVYSYSISGGAQGNDSGDLTFPQESSAAGDISYPSAIPSFSNYSAIQNLNPSQAFTFDFSGFQALTDSSDQSLLFLDIYNAAGVDVFSDDFLPATTTSVTLPAGTLLAETSYSVALDYSNRETTTDGGFADEIDPFVGLDYSTSADFTTAIPEPAVSYLIVAGLGLLVVGRKFSRRSKS
jgi:hypothetical protein